jgi:hypothetical protein
MAPSSWVQVIQGICGKKPRNAILRDPWIAAALGFVRPKGRIGAGITKIATAQISRLGLIFHRLMVSWDNRLKKQAVG